RPSVDLHRAGPALAGFAVPPDGQVVRLRCLQPVQDVQHDLALVHLDGVWRQLALAAVPAPHAQRCLVSHQCVSSVAGAAPYAAATVAAEAGAGMAVSSSWVRYFFSSSRSNKASRSSRIGGVGCRVIVIMSPSSAQARLSLRHSGFMPG